CYLRQQPRWTSLQIIRSAVKPVQKQSPPYYPTLIIQAIKRADPRGAQHDQRPNTADSTCVGLSDGGAFKKISELADRLSDDRTNGDRRGHGTFSFLGGIYWWRRLICIA